MKNKSCANFRKCIVTQQILPKSFLIRIVKQKDGKILINSNALGRGAYIAKNCRDFKTIQHKRILNRVFRTNVNQEVYDELITLLKGMQENEKR